jgi:hypothetical protein
MALKAELESLDGVPEALQEFYPKDEKSGKYFLAVEGLVPKARVDEFRQNNINLSREKDRLAMDLAELRKAYGEVEPEHVLEMKKTLDSIKDKKVLDDEGIEALLEKRLSTLRLEHENAAKARDKRISELQNESDNWSSKFRRTVIDRAISDAALKSGARPQAVPDVVLRGQSMWTLNEHGKPIARSSETEIMYGKDGTSPLTPAEWMDILKQEAPHFFEVSSGGGAPGSTNGTGGLSKTKVRFKSDLKTPGEKSAFISEHGFAAFEALPLKGTA